MADELKPTITAADLAAKFPLALMSQLMPPSGVNYQLWVKDSIIVPGNPAASLKMVGQAPTLDGVSGEVVRRGLMEKPHAITCTVILVSRD